MFLFRLLTMVIMTLFTTFIYSDTEDTGKPEKQRLDTCGQILHASIVPEGLHLSGWLYRFHTTPPITKVKICYGLRRVLHEWDFEAKNNRFDFIISLSSKERRSIKDSLIWMIPLANNQEGYPFYYVLDTALPFPPQSEVDLIGGGDLMAISSQFLGILKDRCGLKETDRMLEVGCGLGRMAYSLAYYLKGSGEYKGFDISASLVARAQSSITPWFSNFDFAHFDLFNKAYNPNGKLSAATFDFPYADEYFDFVSLPAVFTHMTPGDMKHYIREIKRVLRPGGKCMATMFLLNKENEGLMAKGKSALQFNHKHGDCYVVTPASPEAAVAYNEGLAINWFEEAGFKVEKIMPGNWSGREENWVTYQDVVLISKP
jgi:ubiquinone/menaquinone biosynthesis C-methylase UbiE